MPGAAGDAGGRKPLPGAPRGRPALPAPGFRTSASRAGRGQGPVASRPQSAGLCYSRPRTLVPGGSGAPRVCPQRVGAWRRAWAKLEGSPRPAAAATRDCSSRGCPCHLPTSSGGALAELGARACCVPPWGTGRASGLPQGSPSPWWCWGWGVPPSETQSQGLDSSISRMKE